VTIQGDDAADRIQVSEQLGGGDLAFVRADPNAAPIFAGTGCAQNTPMVVVYCAQQGGFNFALAGGDDVITGLTGTTLT
jgi:hypothetical protein